MLNQLTKPRKETIYCGEKLEPMLGYCCKVIVELNPDDSHKLSEDLLSVVNNFRPLIKAKKKSCPILVDLLDWDAVLRDRS